VRDAAKELGLKALITDDYLEVEHAVAEAHPELVLGTQMERHIAKRLGIPCAVISAPAHVQDYPARYSPQMGHEGANVIFDSWVHPLMMGLEEHLLAMFREDFEFHDNAAPSHLAAETGPATAGHGASGTSMARETATADIADGAAPANGPTWDISAEKELRKIPFFVRGKARRNTEQYASERGVTVIKVDTLYEAKAHFSR
jgi:light-independent protochlorophyllide reductase subunit B